MPARKEMAGERVGAWLVLEVGPQDRHKQFTWKCRCDCGTVAFVTGGRLRRGESKSCGCTKAAACAAANIKHGASARGAMTPEYRAWQLIIDRCEREGNKSFKDYGERGIAIAPEWRNDFPAFLSHIGPRPSHRHSVDRIKNELGYQPGNVRWATRAEQNSNKRNNVYLEFRGERRTQSEWARIIGCSRSTLCLRLKNGMTPEEALSKPFKTQRVRENVAPETKERAA